MQELTVLEQVILDSLTGEWATRSDIANAINRPFGLQHYDITCLDRLERRGLVECRLAAIGAAKRRYEYRRVGGA